MGADPKTALCEESVDMVLAAMAWGAGCAASCSTAGHQRAGGLERLAPQGRPARVQGADHGSPSWPMCIEKSLKLGAVAKLDAALPKSSPAAADLPLRSTWRDSLLSMPAILGVSLGEIVAARGAPRLCRQRRDPGRSHVSRAWPLLQKNASQRCSGGLLPCLLFFLQLLRDHCAPRSAPHHQYAASGASTLAEPAAFLG